MFRQIVKSPHLACWYHPCLYFKEMSLVGCESGLLNWLKQYRDLTVQARARPRPRDPLWKSQPCRLWLIERIECAALESENDVHWLTAYVSE